MKSVDASLATSRRDRVPRTYLPFRNFRAYMQFRMSRRLHCARGRDSHRVPHRGARTDAAAYSGHPRPTDVHAVCGLGLCAALSYVTYVCYQRSQAGVGGVKAEGTVADDGSYQNRPAAISSQYSNTHELAPLPRV